jgi:hypothetical protein
MVPFNEKEIPAMPGTSRGQKGQLVEAKECSIGGASPLAQGAKIEYLDKCVTCKVENPTNAERPFQYILMSINGKQRWISTGTLTQRDWNGTGQFVSPEVGADASQYDNAQDLYDNLHTRKMEVKEILHTKRAIWEGGVQTDKLQSANYPVIVYAE